MNCLIGPGDSTKTTILDAIELALNPRSYSFADDSDFYDLDYDHPINIVVTIGGLPVEFNSDDRYGMHLRGWNEEASKIEDEPGFEFGVSFDNFRATHRCRLICRNCDIVGASFEF